MATVVNAPSNPFKRAIMRNIGLGGSHAPSLGNEKSGASKGSLGNPLLGDIGDPSLNQTFAGPFAGFAQFGQQLAQHNAYQKSQQDIEDAMSSLQEKMQGGAAPGKALAQLLTENPKAFMTLHGAGMLDASEKLQQFMMQAQMAGQVGQGQTIDLGGGNKIGFVIGPDLKPHYMNMPAVSQQNADLRQQIANAPRLVPGVTGPGGGTATQTQTGQIGEAPGFKPTSTANAETKATIAAQKPHWDSQTHSWIYQPDANGNVQTVAAPEPVAKLTQQDKNFFSVAPNLYKALGDLQDLAGAVSGPVTGKLRTLSGRLLGEGEVNMQWNAAMANAQNAIASMGSGGGGYVAGMKERLSNLPKDWQASDQNRTIAKGTMDDLANQTIYRAAAAENNGMLPDEIANGLAGMGYFGKKFAPSLTKLRNDPGTLTTQEIDNVVNYGPHLKAQDRDALKQEILKRAGASANQATQPGGGGLDEGNPPDNAGP